MFKAFAPGHKRQKKAQPNDWAFPAAPGLTTSTPQTPQA